tara:strand:+ start:14782 stop:15168 length:387 start_codon:yes stop_codon:yes gene_type:complete
MLNNILGGLFGKVVDNAEGILDKVITTDKERLQAKKELKDLLINAEKSAQEQVTRRWEADAKSGHWLSANIRPLTLIFLTVMFVVMSMFDGNVGGFTIEEAYRPIYQTLLITVYGAYFAGRSIEKIKK